MNLKQFLLVLNIPEITVTPHESDTPRTEILSCCAEAIRYLGKFGKGRLG